MQSAARLILLVLAVTPVIAACSTVPDGATTTTPEAADSRAPRGAIPGDAFPFTASTAVFATREGEVRELHMALTATGARTTITDGVSPLGHYDWSRVGADVLLSDGPDRSIAMLRVGAQPGASWVSSGRTITFDGWERVATPAGSYDAVRITSSTVTKGVVESETWWFAPGVGLVRLTQNKGDLFTTEMWRTR